jgi:AsmA protein
LAGTASAQLKDGAIKGINLAKSLREFKAKFSKREDASQQASATEKTDFSALSASFRIAGGIARNDDLDGRSPLFRLAGAGDIDIGKSAIDYLAKATVVNTSTGQDGKDLEQLRGVTVPVRLTGPFDALSYRIEFAAMAGDVVKAKVEEKLKDKLGDRLGGGLKGLFGR